MGLFDGIFAGWGRKEGSGRGDRGSAPGSIPPLNTSVDQLLRDDFAMVFKHSTACPVSWAAHGQVTRFLRENPGAPVRMVRVIQERAVSQKIAALTGVRHESPQIIVLRRGQVIASASHGKITLENLIEMAQKAQEPVSG